MYVFLSCIKDNTQYIKGMSLFPEVLILHFINEMDHKWDEHPISEHPSTNLIRVQEGLSSF
jgi:hypothetical protein